jgi:hypothetical protein
VFVISWFYNFKISSNCFTNRLVNDLNRCGFLDNLEYDSKQWTSLQTIYKKIKLFWLITQIYYF